MRPTRLFGIAQKVPDAGASRNDPSTALVGRRGAPALISCSSDAMLTESAGKR
jgi:hypothetical protein